MNFVDRSRRECTVLSFDLLPEERACLLRHALNHCPPEEHEAMLLDWAGCHMLRERLDSLKADDTAAPVAQPPAASAPTSAELDDALECRLFGRARLGEALCVLDPELGTWSVSEEPDAAASPDSPLGEERRGVFFNRCCCSLVEEGHRCLVGDWPAVDGTAPPIEGKIGGHYVSCLRASSPYSVSPEASARVLAAVRDLPLTARERFRASLSEQVTEADPALGAPDEADLLFFLSPRRVAIAALAAIEALTP